MHLKSLVFEHGGQIPQKYTCQGLDISPPLIIEEVSSKAQSLALIMEDPDVPLDIKKDGLWVHWVLYNLSSETAVLEEATKIGTAGYNSGETLGFMGPCPPDRRHRYFFTVYALDRKTDFPQGLTKSELLELITPMVLDSTVLIGTYEKF